MGLFDIVLCGEWCGFLGVVMVGIFCGDSFVLW